MASIFRLTFLFCLFISLIKSDHIRVVAYIYDDPDNNITIPNILPTLSITHLADYEVISISQGILNDTNSVEISFPTTYNYSVVLNSNNALTLSWSYVPSIDALALKLERNGKGWMGLGIGARDIGMTGADMGIVDVLSDSVQVRDFYATGYETPLTDIVKGGKNSILSYRGTIENNKMVVEWIRPMIAEDDYDNSIAREGFQNVAFAFGSADSIIKHGPSDKSSLRINWFTGETRSNREVLKLVHGSMMFIGWGFFLFLGMLWARYARLIKKESDIWFKVHQVTQPLGFLIALIGFIVAFFSVQSHFAGRSGAHGAIGVFIMILAVVQIIWAFARPHDTDSTARRAFEIFHQWVGRLLILFAIVNIFVGLFEIQAGGAYFIAFGLYVIIAIIIAIICEVVGRKKGKEKE